MLKRQGFVLLYLMVKVLLRLFLSYAAKAGKKSASMFLFAFIRITEYDPEQ